MATWIELNAAAELVQDGHTLALGGMTMYRRPVAFVRALLARQPRPRNLTLLAFTASYESDLLVGAGCIKQVRSCYFGLEAFGFAPMFTSAAQQGQISVIEETEMSLAMGIRAAMSKLDFLPGRGWLGTDLPRLRPDVKTITDPYSGEELMAFPAIVPDVAVVHALEADPIGNYKLNANVGVDEELVNIAKCVIVTAERQVDHIERDLENVTLPAPTADYITLAPRGAWPTSCYPLYPFGGEELMRYVEMCSAGQFDAYLQKDA